RVDLFAIGKDGDCIHSSWKQDTQWDSWKSLSGNMQLQPVAVSRSPDYIDVFVLGKDCHVYHKEWHSGTWTQWDRLEGVFESKPTVVAMNENRLDVFALDARKAVWHKTWNGNGWNGPWESLAFVGECASIECVCSPSESRLDVFVVGTNALCQHKVWKDGTWRESETIGGAFAAMSAVRLSTSQIMLFSIKNDGT